MADEPPPQDVATEITLADVPIEGGAERILNQED